MGTKNGHTSDDCALAKVSRQTHPSGNKKTMVSTFTWLSCVLRHKNNEGNGNKLYVGNLSFRVTNEDLQEHFSTAGAVESANVLLIEKRAAHVALVLSRWRATTTQPAQELNSMDRIMTAAIWSLTKPDLAKAIARLTATETATADMEVADGVTRRWKP